MQTRWWGLLEVAPPDPPHGGAGPWPMPAITEPPPVRAARPMIVSLLMWIVLFRLWR